MANDLREHSVVIEVFTDDNGWQKIGSGTLIKVNRTPNILTAWHVAAAAFEYNMRACPVLEERTKCVEVLWPWMTDIGNANLYGDWALFQLVDKPDGMTPARFRQKPAVVGEEVMILASPASSEGSLSTGVISGYRWSDWATFDYLIMSDAFAFFGSSGGGMYDRNGYLIGVVVALAAPGDFPLPHMNYSVPAAEIRDYLDKQ
jgi:S1-C subfamily serine protease